MSESSTIENQPGANPKGRPTKYSRSLNSMAYKLCLLGCTDEQLSDFFSVSVATINNWKKEFPTFYNAVRRGKLAADAEVAKALYKRAIGYKFTETTFERVDFKEVIEKATNAEIMQDIYKKKIVVKDLAPDVGACINWLKNRQRDLWSYKNETELTGKDGQPFTITLDLT